MENDLRSSEQIKAKFFEIGTPFINQMSTKLIKDLNDIIKPTNKTLKTQILEDKFKTDMIDKWSEELDSLWESKNVHDRLTLLNVKKVQLKENAPSQHKWRAHGHTAEQQTQLSRNKAMTMYSHQMRDLLAKQSEELQALIFEVEERRNFFNEVSKRRTKVILDTKMEDLQKEWDELNLIETP